MKTIAMALVGMLGGAALVGCESANDRPYGLTGEQELSRSERLKYTDQKGHYRPEYAARGEAIRPVPRND
jgi:hypothetical protein